VFVFAGCVLEAKEDEDNDNNSNSNDEKQEQENDDKATDDKGNKDGNTNKSNDNEKECDKNHSFNNNDKNSIMPKLQLPCHQKSLPQKNPEWRNSQVLSPRSSQSPHRALFYEDPGWVHGKAFYSKVR
jgi:hypothetical protein